MGAFAKNCYFPPPDLCIGSAGATCDDMAAVIQGAYGFRYPFFWFEIPFLRETSGGNVMPLTAGPIHPDNGHLKRLIMQQLNSLADQLSQIAGAPFREEALAAAISKINALRSSIERTRQYAYRARGAALPALEMMNLEFMAMAFYADLDEALDIALALRLPDVFLHRQFRGSR